jgi:hypothetical protein
MIISDRNAFTINQQAGSFFPFSLKVSETEDVVSMFLCAQRVIDVCDVIESHALDSLAIFGLGQTSSFDEQTDEATSLVNLAAEAKVTFSAIDTQTIVLPKQNLLPLLSTFDHYNLSLFDIGNNWTEDQVISQVMAYREHDWRGQETILSKLPGSTFFLNSHDDCYLTIESYDYDVPKHIFARALQIYVGTILAENQQSPSDIPEIPPNLLDMFWKDSFNITILRETTSLEKGQLKIGLSQQAYSFSESGCYEPEFWVSYDSQSQKWLMDL